MSEPMDPQQGAESGTGFGTESGTEPTAQPSAVAPAAPVAAAPVAAAPVAAAQPEQSSPQASQAQVPQAPVWLNRRGKPIKLNRRGKPKTHHTLVIVICFVVALAVATLYFIYTVPSKMTSGYKTAFLVNGLGTGAPFPVNTLYTEPDIASPDTATATILSTGNQDTLYTFGWLDLSNGPLVLSVPDMNDRYYSIQLTNPKIDNVFAYVGRRTTGTAAGSFLITGPGWKGTVPNGMTQISSPVSEVMLLGRVYVANEGDVPAAYKLSQEITLAPLD